MKSMKIYTELNSIRGTLRIILETEDWPNFRNFKTEDLKIRLLSSEDLKTALF